VATDSESVGIKNPYHLIGDKIKIVQTFISSALI
jgi:hypothetical protein